jgi:hypothetical protein
MTMPMRVTQKHQPNTCSRCNHWESSHVTYTKVWETRELASRCTVSGCKCGLPDDEKSN